MIDLVDSVGSDSGQVLKLPSEKKPATLKRERVSMMSHNVLVPGAGIEPALLSEQDFESSASTNSTTRAGGRCC